MLKGILRSISLAVVLTLATGLFAGCGSSDQKPADSTAATTAAAQEGTASVKKPVQITVVKEGSDFAIAKKTQAVWEGYASDYETKSGNKIEFIHVPDKDYRTWQITQQAAGSIPDVYSTRLAWVWEDYTKGLVQDMGPFLEKESPYNPGMKWKDTFTPSLMSQSIEPASGKMTSVLRAVGAVRILYNKDLFTKAGIEKEPVTWIEFMDACAKLEKIGVTPFSFAMQNSAQYASWFLTSIFGQLDEPLRKQMDTDGDNMVSKNEFAKATDKNLIDYSKSPFKEGFELFKNFSKYWNSDFNAIDTKMAQQLWLTGKTAMNASLLSDVVTVDEMQGRNFEYGAFPMPTITKETDLNAMGKSVMIGGAANESWAISKNVEGDKLDAAVDFVMYLTSPAAQGIQAKELYEIPVITNATLPDNLKGFVIRDTEDIRRANYTGPATLNEFSTFLTMNLQLYLTDKLDFGKFTTELNKEWTKGMATAKSSNNWSEENNYGMKK